MDQENGAGLQPLNDKRLITGGGTIVTITVDVKEIGTKDDMLRKALRAVINALVEDDTSDDLKSDGTDLTDGITVSYLPYWHAVSGRSLPQTKKR